MKEEVGLDVELWSGEDIVRFPRSGRERTLIRPELVNRHRIDRRHEHVSFYYIATSKSEKLKLSTTEVSGGCGWFTAEELDDPAFSITETIRIYAKRALGKAGR